MPDVREKLVELLNEMQDSGIVETPAGFGFTKQHIENDKVASHLIANGVTVIPPEGIGEMSDGYHTFNELYHHRAVLFSVICNAMPDKAWKSKRHDTGDMYDGMFIVGIETNHGQATYHYDVDPYWDMFNVPELEYAPKWDGHTPQEAINRIAHGATVQEWISVKDRMPEQNIRVLVWMQDNEEEYTQIDTDRWSCTMEQGYHWIRWGNRVTHWMPLPEPPKEE